jgi:hypothetical protein
MLFATNLKDLLQETRVVFALYLLIWKGSHNSDVTEHFGGEWSCKGKIIGVFFLVFFYDFHDHQQRKCYNRRQYEDKECEFPTNKPKKNQTS